MIPGLDHAACDVLELLASLHEQVVAGRDLNGYALPGIGCPDIETWVPRAAVNREEVEVGLKTGQNGVLPVLLLQV